ncbi:2886_t:CDS:2 [Paraglomus occultum]|uniref:2886_t:CDS:1 n=1 Tax=Paraglomus occultum TaxID=144539 RepID=A0A9N9AE36_9GLOM|nr:2886_t:CDS:2 [Paraglomus occultum]
MVDITPEFRKILNELGPQDEKTREDILPPVKKNPKFVQNEFTREAYQIASHISNLRTYLLSVRRAYLNLSRHSIGSVKSTNSASTWKNQTDQPSVNTLTDKERDEIDLHAKTIIQQCLDRIKLLEESEHARQNTHLNNPLSMLLPTALLPEEHDLLAAHRSSIIWLLNMKLTEVSKIQKDQQKARIMKELAKRESVLYKPASKSAPSASPSLIDVDSEKDVRSKTNNVVIDGREDDFEESLSAEQKMMLDMENVSILKELETTLDQVTQAERALMEISTLQSVLSNHLAVQTQQTDRLYAEAVATSERVREGNQMLTKARQRASDARKGILIFLILASFVLLFLDWFD